MIISAAELEIVSEMLNVLAPIEAVSKEISGEKYSTASKIIPIISCLVKKFETLTPTTTEDTAIEEKIVSEISKRFGSIEDIKLLAVATVFDPRFKRLHFSNPTSCANAVNFISQSIELYKQNDSIEQASKILQRDTTKPDSVWTYHEELVLKHNETQSVTKGELDFDFRLYLNSPTVNLDVDPFLYWSNSSSIPLKKLADKYLSVVGTSVPSERLFSKAGRTIAETRNRLSGERLSKLLFLNSLDFGDWDL